MSEEAIPRTDAAAIAIGRIAAKLRMGDITLARFAEDAQLQFDKLAELERELITERELRVAAEKALENAGVPIELEWEEPLTLAQRIEWLHTAKGLSTARSVGLICLGSNGGQTTFGAGGTGVLHVDPAYPTLHNR